MPAEKLKNSGAAVLIVLGQSNAHGHGLAMREEDKILEPLRNVWGLGRELNQSLDLQRVTWTGYTTHGMNLGETQDHTYCLASEFAKLWQGHVDAGNEMGLPDLYIIQISIGAQGVSLCKGEKWNMWYPYREPRLIPGKLCTVDISLYPFTVMVLQLAMDDLRSRKANPVVIGLHWSGGNDTGLPIGQLTDLESHFRYMFAGFRKAVGQEYTQYVYKQLHVQRAIDLGNPIESLHFNNRVYQNLADTIGYIRILSAQDSPYWEEGTMTNGIFVEDHVHYTEEVHKWFARYQFEHL